MSDLTARAIADLKAELAESKAEANKVTESMGSEILRLQCELEQQRTRAEAADQELRDERQRVNSGEWVEKAHAETVDKACKELETKLARFARWMVRMGRAWTVNPDWACSRCCPHSTVLVAGFVCVFHEAEDIAAAREVLS